MNFYEVWVRSVSYRGTDALTYHYSEKLPTGSFVKVELQKNEVWGVVVKNVAKPAFKTKAIIKVVDTAPLPMALLSLGKQVLQFYAAPVGAITQLLMPADPEAMPKKVLAPVPTKTALGILPPLTSEQISAINDCSDPGPHLLHGKTGSGKTRVYIELARKALEQNRSSIIMTPEISLTSQLSQRFRAVFGDKVAVLHSRLTAGERQRVWHQIVNNTTPTIVIGARSALFSPLVSVGLIVVDEAHEPAYKQEQTPYYHATRVASMLASIHDATLVLGTATPTVSDYYLAEQKKAPIVTMNTLATTGVSAIRRIIVDLTDRSLFSRSNHLSQPLIEAVQASLAHGEQSMLFLNRRGTARIILCDQCGWQSLCPHCDLPLTYHADTHVMLCHSCNFRGDAPTSCPQCGNPSIIYKSAGTKSIVDEIERLFPEARVQRFDTDNRKAERFEQHYDAVHSGDVDIIVGTQLLAKGLDLPKLSTLGIILADSSLAMPDFSSAERTYQLLTQVLGRVGRGHRDSTAIIQTYNPSSLAIQAAINDNWSAFYDSELREREKFAFPPFYFLLKLTCRRATAKAAEKTATTMKNELESNHTRVRVEGPAPSFHEHTDGKYEWQLVVKAKQRQLLLDIVARLPSSGWTYDIDPINLL
jgi:primosomal protein N' (replication factor Y)